MFPVAQNRTPEEIRVGLAAEFEREITEEDILTFARNSGDANPLHVDAEYARTTNFQRRLVHGAFQVGLASAMVGMHLPGRNVLLGSVNARFLQPLYFPSRVLVRGEIISWNLPQQRGSLKVNVLEVTARVPVAEITMSFTFHEKRQETKPLPIPAADLPASSADRKIVLVTGASGGIGAALVSALARDYTVFGLVNRNPLDAGLRSMAHVAELQADLAEPGWDEKIAGALGQSRLYGIVHAAWPGPSRGGLLEVQDDVLERQLSFGASHTIRLARLLAGRCAAEGGRLIVLGSIYGTMKPALGLAAYSLGKATMEHTVRLLAPELARKKITINAVCPGFVPVGMNRQVDERQRAREAALVPLGRLCDAEDIAEMVRYLLSSGASFASGQIIGITGAQL